MTASVFAAAARLLAASNDEDLLEAGSDGHMRAVHGLAAAQAEMSAMLLAAGVDVKPCMGKLPDLHLANPDGTVNGSFHDALAKGLTSKSDIERCFHRGIAAGITDPVVAWASSEVERGTEPAIILISLMELVIQQVASLTGNFLNVEGRQFVLKHFHEQLDTQFLKHAARIASMLPSEHRIGLG